MGSASFSFELLDDSRHDIEDLLLLPAQKLLHFLEEPA